MEFSHPKAETYAEKKLAEQLEFATNALRPGTGYRLTLEGLKPPTLTLKELEAFWGVELDPEQGARVDLQFDETTQGLRLQELAYPVKGVSGAARLIYTETLGYIPLIDIAGKDFLPRKSSQGFYLPYARAEQLLDQFGIPPVSFDDASEYQSWRTTLLARTQGWHLHEQLEIPTEIGVNRTKTITFVNEETYGPDLEEVVAKKSVVEGVIEHTDDSLITLHFDRIIELTSVLSDKTLSLRNATYSEETDPIVLNQQTQSDLKQEAVPINEDNFHLFSGLLREATQIKHDYFRLAQP